MNNVKQQSDQNSRNATQKDDKELKSHAQNNFKALVFTLAKKSSKNNCFVASRQTQVLEKHLDELLPCLSTPNHPPYSAMIEEAIQQLNEEQGSSEEAISAFLKKTFGDLPFFHDALLKHHIVELCKKGDIVQTCNGAYSINYKRDISTIILTSPSNNITVFEPGNNRRGNERIPISTPSPCNNKKSMMEGNMESSKKEKGKDMPLTGRTRSSIKKLGPSISK